VFLNLNKEVMKYMIIKLDDKPSLDVNNEESTKEDAVQEEN
jgi:ribosomal protein S6